MPAQLRAAMIRPSVAMAILWLGISTSRVVHGAQGTCAHYEPDVVRLRGHLSIDRKYGAPNYGETPTKDAKLEVAMLHLARPLDVCGDTRDATTSESFKGLTVVQLNFANLRVNLKRYADQAIVVKGTLYRGETGWHYTEVLMTVDRVAVAR
jgi:hypothetical protein